VSHIGVAGTAAYLPERWMTSGEIAEASGIPEDVVREKFGLRGKHIAAPDEHVSDLSVKVGETLLAEHGVDPADVDVVVYFGSSWKDYAVWQVAPLLAHRLRCERAFALELDYVSCGGPVALRVSRDLLLAEPHLSTVLAIGASRESYLLDYGNERARFMFNFGDGAAGALITRDHPRNELLSSAMVTDGRLALQVKVPAGGSVEPSSRETVGNGRHFLDVADTSEMKERLDSTSLQNFATVAEEALERSGHSLGDVSWVCGIHMKRSMYERLIDALGVAEERAPYLDDTGHMSGVDPVLALDRLSRARKLQDGELVLLLAAGTGYTWAATVVRWGDGR
jgi:3-oxoacyl-[acyl-carrier-protein] synthase-3